MDAIARRRRVEGRPPRSAARTSSILFYLALVVGAAWRILLIFSPAFQPDSDRAVVYLMARHVGSGDFSTFYWGQSYGGTLLQLTAGLVMRVTGAHIAVLAIVGMLFWAAAAWFTRGIARELIGQVGGDVAGILVWFSGVGVVLTSILDPGFYGPTLALSLAAVWLIVRGPAEKPLWQWALIGLLSGLAFWQSPLGAAIAGPFIVWQALRQRRWLAWLVGVVAIVVGALPWLRILLLGNLTALAPHGGHLPVRSFYTLFTQLFPAAFVMPAAPMPGVLRLGIAAIAFLVMAAFLVVAVLRRRVSRLLLVAGLVLATIVIVFGSGVQLAADSYRYAGFVLPFFAIATAWLLTTWRRFALGGVAVGVALAIVCSIPLWSHSRPVTGAQRAAIRWGADALNVADYLRSQGADAATGDYWLAYRLTASQDESITMSALVVDRFAPYDAAAAAARPGFVVVQAGGANDTRIAGLKIPGATRTVVDGWAVYRLPDGTASLGRQVWDLF